MEIREFDQAYLTDAAVLLQERQNRAVRGISASLQLDLRTCMQQIKAELERKTVFSCMAFDEDALIGFMVAEAKMDQVWGDAGWVHAAGWAIRDGREQALLSLYSETASWWMEHAIPAHYFESFVTESEWLLNLGFAREQVYGIMDLDETVIPVLGESPYTVREAVPEDQDQISGFSRVIAGYQQQVPCLAPVPESYLKALDKGFSTLTTEEDIDLYVVEDEGTIMGVILFENVDGAGMFVPSGAEELVICAVKEEFRHRKAGLRLAVEALAVRKEQGIKEIVTDWRSANPLSSRFWQQLGFNPVLYRLVRRIDSLHFVD